MERAPRIIVLTTFDLDEAATRAIRGGASGFLLKDADPEFLLAAIRTVHAGTSVIAAAATRELFQHFDSQAATRIAPPEFVVADLARARHLPARRARPEQLRDRAGRVPQRGDREDAHQPHPVETGAARPRAARRLRVRERPRRLTIILSADAVAPVRLTRHTRRLSLASRHADRRHLRHTRSLRRARREPQQVVRHRQRTGCRRCAGSASASSAGASWRSWGRAGRASRPSCTFSPGSTPRLPVESGSARPRSRVSTTPPSRCFAVGGSGFVFQSYNLVPTLDVEGNILLPFELDGRRPNEDERAWIFRLVQSLGLQSTASAPPARALGRTAAARRDRTSPGDPSRSRARG